jgi:hypothetical protein
MRRVVVVEGKEGKMHQALLSQGAVVVVVCRLERRSC